MTGFLAKLATMASGVATPGAAHVALPSRFAASTNTRQQIDTAPRDAFVPDAEKPLQPPRTHGRTASAADDPDEAQPHRRSARRVPDEVAPRAHDAATADANDATMRRPAADTTALASSPAVTHPQKSALRDSILPATPARDAASREASAPRHSDRPAFVRAPPLSEATLAGQSPRRRDAAPIVQVTIDRIDVRSPELARREAAAEPARPKPSVSLADYLRRPGTRGRA